MESEEEVFYDSLDESEASSPHSPIPEEEQEKEIDLEQVVPLYTGEIDKRQLGKVTRKKSDRNLPKKHDLIGEQKKSKSYLTMYYERINQNASKFNTSGSMTSRAVCDTSPRNIAELDQQAEDQSDQEANSDEEFFHKFLAAELDRKTASDLEIVQKSENKTKTSVQNSPPASDRPFLLKTSEGDNVKKLESLKKRLTYGTKMSKRNMIEIGEMKELQKIKHCAKLKK